MNRRNFIGSACAAVAALMLPWRRSRGATVVRTFKVSGLNAGELIDIKTWHSRRYRRLFLDGQDVTCEAFLCHTGEGWADCFVREPLPLDAKPGQLGTVRIDRTANKSVVVRRFGKLEIR